MFRILILDNHTEQLEPLSKELENWPGLSIAYLQSYIHAIDLIELSPPDLLISAFECERVNAFEFIWEMKRRFGEVPETLFYLPEGCHLGGEIFKTLDLDLCFIQEDRDKVFQMIQNRMDRKKRALPPEGFSFSRVEPQILLAMASGLDVQVQIHGPEGPQGEILVSQGGIWSARDAEGSGPEAFLRLLDRGEIAACSLIDKELMGPYGFEQEEDEDAQELIDRGIDAILSKELEEAATLFLRAEKLAPDNPLVKANLDRLQSMGILPM